MVGKCIVFHDGGRWIGHRRFFIWNDIISFIAAYAAQDVSGAGLVVNGIEGGDSP